MDKEERYTLEILNRIEENGRVTQPEIAKHLGISIGLANSFIKRIAHKGYIKLTTIPRDRAKYLITPQGIAAKSRLTIKYLQYSLNFYKKAKDTIARAYALLEKEGVKHIVFYGVGELAEIAFILLQQHHMKLTGVIDDQKQGKMFLKHRVGAIEDIKSLSFEKIIVTVFDSPEKIIEKLITAAVPEHKMLILREVSITQNSANARVEQAKDERTPV